ncbi:CBASS cGAMP synthase [Caulobacter radicis]|uniref:Cyclic GMP-AMP synthase n=1 Tax=Caulobacter radicis TaxID=2172650 RepID=A0A2T9JN60_9CAUL|nr:hypothetical protein [Caulobacter radicis]PVM85123.1 hypothetical protein DDF65_07410 [Caulobacter radicis]
MAINAHRAFTSSSTNNYLAGLTVERDREDELRAARDDAREAVRNALRTITSPYLFESATVEQSALRPKFRMQGSFAYRTLNDPSQAPQEIDLDDGMFVPVSFLTGSEGNARPGIISDRYFEAVEAALAPLCDARGWELETDLPSCVRIRLNDGAHVDMALYAIPDEEFAILVEKAAPEGMANDSLRAAADSIEFSEQVYRDLDPDQIMLAHREEGWKPSDPRKLDEWFQEGLKAHGEQFRRVCRYLKGWRDHTWSSCRLASIALMACARASFDADKSIADNRDDLRMLDVSQRLPEQLKTRIRNPVVEGQFLDEKWDKPARDDFVQKAQDLAGRLEDALLGSDSKQAAVNALIGAFGPRVPNDVSLILTDDDPSGGGVPMPAILKSGMLHELGREPAVRDVVRKDGDGRYG